MVQNMEDLTDRELLEAIYEQQEEDHIKISKLYRRAKFQWIFGILKWVIYIGIAVGLYAYLQPFLQNIINTYSSLQESAKTIGEIKGSFPSFPFFQ